MLASCSFKYHQISALGGPFELNCKRENFKTQKPVQSEDRGEIIYDGGVGLELIPTRIVYLCK